MRPNIILPSFFVRVIDARELKESKRNRSQSFFYLLNVKNIVWLMNDLVVTMPGSQA